MPLSQSPGLSSAPLHEQFVVFFFKQALTPSAANSAFAPVYHCEAARLLVHSKRNRGNGNCTERQENYPKSSKLPARVTTLPPAATTYDLGEPKSLSPFTD